MPCNLLQNQHQWTFHQVAKGKKLGKKQIETFGKMKKMFNINDKCTQQ